MRVIVIFRPDNEKDDRKNDYSLCRKLIELPIVYAGMKMNLECMVEELEIIEVSYHESLNVYTAWLEAPKMKLPREFYENNDWQKVDSRNGLDTIRDNKGYSGHIGDYGPIKTFLSLN
ncbi:MAG: hypothetical protein WC587_01555 [Candidatus Paceibacterota bacterium]